MLFFQIGLGLTACGTTVIQEQIRGNAIQPSAAIRGGGQLVHLTECPQEGLLEQIFPEDDISRQSREIAELRPLIAVNELAAIDRCIPISHPESRTD
ncbi:MAG: hypothetical protein CL483_15800 [Acidobacteria bacterium]|nr:hypothetical protein [Acidobacteriota bacterium]|tara:strand:- start:350 stop:640 length:291 start_codon:yes stop_codon:yes gene_type:complete